MKKYIFTALALAVVLGISLYFRLFPAYFPQLKAQARTLVVQQVQQGIARDVYQKFPQFNPLANDKLIKTRVEQYLLQNKDAVNTQVNELYPKIKDRFQDEKGQTYMMELDCWHWSRYVDNVLRLRHPGDEVVHGAQWDTFMLAPTGYYILWDQFLFYFSAVLYKIFTLFHAVPLFTFLFYLPLFFMALFLIALYFFASRYSGYLGGMLACLLVGCSQIFLPRSCAGWFDKDILNLLFPVLVVWAYLLASQAAGLKKKLFWLTISAFWVGIFCFNWTHWWFVVLIILIFEFVYGIFIGLENFLLKREDFKFIRERSLLVLPFLGLSVIWILIFCGFEPLAELFKQVALAMILNKPLISSVWPNVYSTVGELRKLSLLDTANSVGGVVIFIASVLSMIFLSIRFFLNRKAALFKFEALLLLVIWAVAMFFAATRGIRFVVFLLVPFGVFLGWGVNELFEISLKRKNIFGMIAAGILLVGFSIILINKANATARNIYPLMSDTWYKVLKVVDEQSAKDTILNSWWDFGDWFKVVGKRRVIFDGQSQDKPQAYWMAKAIINDDEEEAVAILRMLNNGGNKAFEVIDTYFKDPLQSALLLEKVITMPAQKAQEELLGVLPVPAVQEVMKLVFYNPGKACFIVDPTMQFKMPAISYLGNWDFAKVYIVQNFKSKEKDKVMERLAKLGRNLEESQRYYQEAVLIPEDKLDEWLSRPISFLSPLSAGQEKNGAVYFDNGMVYNPTEQSVRSNNGQVPRSFFMMNEQNQLQEINNSNPNVGYCVLVIKAEEGYRCILLDRELAKSLFVRLYFFNGKGTKHFLPFIDGQDSSGSIRVFNIVW